MRKIDFRFTIGSTDSCLSVMRLAEGETSSGVEFRWRPFNVRHVMVAQNDVLFRVKPVKTAYMRRDIGRRAERYGLAPKLPAPYPLAGLVLANLVAAPAAEEGWVEDHVRATYRRWNARGG